MIYIIIYFIVGAFISGFIFDKSVFDRNDSEERILLILFVILAWFVVIPREIGKLIHSLLGGFKNGAKKDI